MIHSNSSIMPRHSQKQGTELSPRDLKELVHTLKCFYLNENMVNMSRKLAEEYSTADLRKKLQVQQDNQKMVSFSAFPFQKLWHRALKS